MTHYHRLGLAPLFAFITLSCLPSCSHVQQAGQVPEQELRDEPKESILEETLASSGIGHVLPTNQGTLLLIQTDEIFEEDSALLTPEGRERFQQLALALSAVEGRELLLFGHMDREKPEGLAEELSEKRAIALGRILVAAGFPPERITIAGLGSRVPYASNQDPEGRAQNRRMELLIKRAP